jgi:hypothetical protein
MTRHPLRPTALTLSMAALCFLAAPVGAQDRASVGGGSDSALVGGYSMPAARTAPSSAGNFSQAAVQREESIEDAEDLLQRLRSQIGGTAIETPRGDEPLGTDRRGRDVNNALRYRNEVETMVKKHWDQLAPLTRDMYSANYDRSNPGDNSRRYRSPYGDNGQMENKLLGATDDVQGAMQNLEDLLLPMLKDLKQGFDDGLQQQRLNRR